MKTRPNLKISSSTVINLTIYISDNMQKWIRISFRHRTIKVLSETLQKMYFLQTINTLRHWTEKYLILYYLFLFASNCVYKHNKVNSLPKVRLTEIGFKERETFKKQAISPCSASITASSERLRPKSRTTPLNSTPPTVTKSGYCAVQLRRLVQTEGWDFKCDLMC